jgi:hypothetical protein
MQEMMAPRQLVAKLSRRVYRWVDFAPKGFLNRSQRGHDITEGDIANHQQIDIAPRILRAPSPRAIHERDINLAG